jgi:membrane protease YdiL (CAAX protease family)
VDKFPVQVLIALGGIGPVVSAIVLTRITHDRGAQRDYWRRVIDFRRIGAGWYAVILLTVPILTALAVLLDVLFGGSGAQLEVAARFVSQPLAILPFAIFMLFFGPIPEELGWRGYALDRLQVRWSALTSSLVLGTIWALWHLPLFFIVGTYQNSLGFGTLFFWTFMMGLIPGAILYTWIYNNNRRSTLSAVLFHFTVNFIGELFALSERAELFLFLLWILAAIVITIIWGHKTLTRQAKHPDRAKREILKESKSIK